MTDEATERVTESTAIGVGAPQADAHDPPLPWEAAQIMRIIPHRYPFLLIDRVLELDEGKRVVAIKAVTANEPQFTGHFPGRPIMPGVLMVESMAQAGAVAAPEFKGNAALVRTSEYWDKEADDFLKKNWVKRQWSSPEAKEHFETMGTQPEYHYLGSARIVAPFPS